MAGLPLAALSATRSAGCFGDPLLLTIPIIISVITGFRSAGPARSGDLTSTAAIVRPFRPIVMGAACASVTSWRMIRPRRAALAQSVQQFSKSMSSGLTRGIMRNHGSQARPRFDLISSRRYAAGAGPWVIGGIECADRADEVRPV